VAFSLAIEAHAPASVLRCCGYVDIEAARQIRAQIQKLQQQGKRIFILDFSQTPVVNSAALGELIEVVSRALEEPELRFLVSGLAPTCQSSFRIVGIFHCAAEFSDVAEALASLTPVKR